MRIFKGVPALAALLCIAVLFGAALDAQAERQEAQDEKSLVFKAIAVTASTIETVSSDFTQEKFSSMLKNPLVSGGRFAYEKPDRLYWEIVTPCCSGFTVKGARAKRWSGESRAGAKSFDLDRESVMKTIVEQVFAWVRADFSWLNKRYKITVKPGVPATLKLLPLLSQEKKHISYMNIIFSEDWEYVASVEIHERGGDYTRISFTDVVVNESLPTDLFAP